MIDKAGLDPDIAEEAKSTLQGVETQSKKEKPNLALITGKLKSLTELIGAAAGAAATLQQLNPLIQKAVQLAQQLFSLKFLVKKGILSASSAYILWGFFPIYFKSLKSVSSFEILCHRMVWSLVFLTGVLTVTRQWSWLRPALRNRRTFLIYLGAALLLGVNWFTYIWAVNSGFIVESSLGYFINPLVSILLGVFILREKLRAIQWIPVGMAFLGVAYLTWTYGRLPWIALALAFTFGFYGLVKKIAPLSSLYGLSLETGLLFLPALGYLVFREISGTASFLHQGAGISVLLALSGVITAIPLLLFASGARSIPLYLLGLLQYIAPTLQLLIGVVLYHEIILHAPVLWFWDDLVSPRFLFRRSLYKQPSLSDKSIALPQP